jgi:error-prone DNA polymerase
LSINESGRDFQVEGEGIRVALSRVKGIRQGEVVSILKGRPYPSLQDFLERRRVCLDTAGSLVLGGAFDALDDNRRALLCQIEAWRRGLSFPGRPQDFSHAERILQEYEVLCLWVSGHYMEVFRERLRKRGFLSSCELERLRDGSRVRVAGLPVRPHRPPTRSGRTVVFLSLEDETGLIDIVVFENIYQRCGQFIFSPEVLPLEVEGTLKRRGRGGSIVASWVKPMGPGALASWEEGPVL